MTGSIRFDDLRRRNRGIIIASVRRHETVSRTELTGLTGLSHSTISAISADLISAGLLREKAASDGAAAKRGRPQVALGLSPTAGRVVTLVLSLNRISTCLFDFAGNEITRQMRRLSTAEVGRDDLCAAIAEDIDAVIDGGPPIRRIAVAVQGVTDANAEMLRWSPITPHEDLTIGPLLRERFGVPVTVDNDCNMIALALRWREPALYGGNFIAVLLSQGIGMGLVLGGDVFAGTETSAGEFGHMIHVPQGARCRCGGLGCIEAYAGSYAIWRRAKGLMAQSAPEEATELDLASIADAARAGETVAVEAFAEAGTALGYGLGSLFALIDPAPVTFVGQGVSAFDLIEPSLRAAIADTAGGRHARPIEIATVADERPLIEAGCAIRALTLLDEEFAFSAAAAPDLAIAR